MAELSASAIRRLVRSVGVNGISDGAISEIISLVEGYVKNVSGAALQSAHKNGRRTVKPEDVQAVVKS